MGDQTSTGATGPVSAKRVRRPLRVHEDTAMRVSYWAPRHGLSENAYMAEAVEEKIARENGDYDLPTLEQKRLAQLIDEIKSLSTNQANLEKVISSGFTSLVGLARGDNYLIDMDEDGELSG